MKKKLKLTQIRSEAGRLPKHKATLRGLGLRHLNHSVELEETPSVRGMVQQVSYLVRIEEVK
ncbi:MAG: 50S ribosomal protein L30 [Gammaproteobacteria bacterium]|nr:50S ribosomal protein L30 [Gammaproteobacteria bacterium]